MVCVALAAMVAACGGGGGGNSSTSPSSSSTGSTAAPSSPSASSTSSQSATYHYQGSAPAVTGVNGKVAVLMTPDTLNPGSLSGSSINVTNASLSDQVQQTAYGGAFTTIGDTGLSFTLTPGSTIADINGVGGYIAIGRWTAGSDSQAGTYNANQGAVYAVGNPLTLSANTGTMACTALMATSPASASGNVAPGTLNSATATLDLSTRQLSALNMTFTIGSDSAAPITRTNVPAAGGQLTAGFSSFADVMGNDATKPLIALAYAVKLPSTGNVNGLVVLSCQ